MSNILELIDKTKTLRLLYVEDGDHLRAETEHFLKRFFPLLHSCSNGQEAWEELQKNDFDILLTDLKMPVMDGVELIEKVQNKYPQIITIALSGVSCIDEKELIVDYRLCKPIDIETFCTIFESLIDRIN